MSRYYVEGSIDASKPTLELYAMSRVNPDGPITPNLARCRMKAISRAETYSGNGHATVRDIVYRDEDRAGRKSNPDYREKGIVGYVEVVNRRIGGAHVINYVWKDVKGNVWELHRDGTLGYKLNI